MLLRPPGTAEIRGSSPPLGMGLHCLRGGPGLCCRAKIRSPFQPHLSFEFLSNLHLESGVVRQSVKEDQLSFHSVVENFPQIRHSRAPSSLSSRGKAFFRPQLDAACFSSVEERRKDSVVRQGSNQT